MNLPSRKSLLELAALASDCQSYCRSRNHMRIYTSEYEILNFKIKMMIKQTKNKCDSLYKFYVFVTLILYHVRVIASYLHYY
jgi:hypothetical protein